MVRDSAGIRIVENPAPDPAAAPLWTVVAQPRVDIGLLEGAEPYQLSQVGGAVRLSDGRIVVANGGSHELRYFDSTGTYLTKAGRKGGGPGEFETLVSVWALSGDTVAVYDWSLIRISLFGPAGGFMRSIGLELSAAPRVPVGRFADGSWLFTAESSLFPPGGEGTQVVRDTVVLLLFNASGAFRDSVGRFLGGELHVRTEGRSRSVLAPPFGTTTEVAVRGDRFYAGYSGRYEITRYTAAAVPDLIIRRTWTPIPVTGGDVAIYKAERRARSSEGNRPFLERYLQDIPFSSTFPAFDELQVDPLGDLWVLDPSRPGDVRRRWTVFSPDGAVLGAVETPSGLSVREIGRDYVLGTWRDDLDVEHVRLDALQRQ